MANGKSNPVIVLAFANDQDKYLEMIRRERKNIFKVLQSYHDQGYVQVHKEESTAIEDIFELFNRYSDRIAIFHYGGHASGTHLQLEAVSGKAQMANATGLAQLLGQQNALQLVFLNGCATSAQVKLLFDCGVKLVIATSVPIEDVMATEFAEQFYSALASHATIQEAFKRAEAFIATRYGTTKEVREFRNLVWDDAKDKQSSDLPWGLYINDGGEETLKWKLPETSEYTVIIRSGSIPGKRAPINNVLMEALFNAIVKDSPEVSQRLERELRGPHPDLRLMRQAIIDSFPVPIGEQLRKLFAGQDIRVERLQQLVVTYETVIQLFCFAMLSQLWDARHKNSRLAIDEEQAVVLNSFLALNADSLPAFDYFRLMIAVANIFQKNGIAPFFEPFARLDTILQQPEFSRAQSFMEEMRPELLQGKVAAAEIESFCLQAENHLATVMAAFAFLVQYKMTTIKRIDVIKARHHDPKYEHSCVVLDRATAGTLDECKDYSCFTDSQSVIVLKTVDNVENYLSLSPFVIDENALTDNPDSKLFIYSYYETAQDAYHFSFINKLADKLIVTTDNYPQIKRQFEEFREAVFS